MILFAQWKFYLRNGDSFYAMEILFAQWVIYCTRKQKFFLRNDKASNLNHIHFAQSQDLMPMMSQLVLHHFILWPDKSMKKFVLILVHTYYPNSFCTMSTRIPKDSIWLFKEVIFEFRVDSFCAMSVVSVEKHLFLIFSYPLVFFSNLEKQKYLTKRPV